MDPQEFEKRRASNQLLDLEDEVLEACSDEQRRIVAKAKAEHDLSCPSFLDLLTEFHLELLPRNGRSTEDNVLHSNKRLGSFTARAAYESDKLSRNALRVSFIALAVSIALGLLQLVLAVIQLCIS